MKKCNKYQSYFLFSNNDKLNQHILECPDCAKEHAEFEKIANLVKEVKFAYKQKQKSSLLAKVACISALIMFTFTYAAFNSTFNNDYSYESYSQNTVLDEMGMPIDNYGLIKVD